MATLDTIQVPQDVKVDTPIFAKQITIEEYNKQKDEYTQKALKELNEQMKNGPKPITSKTKTKLNISLPNSNDNDNDNDDNDNDNDNGTVDNANDSDSDYTENRENTNSNQSVNFIIKHYVNEQTQPQQQLLKKRKITNIQSSKPLQSMQQTANITDAIYAQHELDIENITKLKLKNNSLKIENEDLDKKKHFLTLELSNAQCDISDLNKQVSYLKDENIKLKQFITMMRKSDEKFELYLSIAFYIFVALSILLIYVFYL